MSAADPPSKYLDTSALAKAFFREDGSDLVLEVLQDRASPPVAAGCISTVELSSAIERRIRSDRPRERILPGEGARAWDALLDFQRRGRLLLLQFTPLTLPRAESLCRKHGLRAYDAVQLSFALELDRTRREFLLPGAQFLCADRELLLAAAAEGMSAMDPGTRGP